MSLNNRKKLSKSFKALGNLNALIINILPIKYPLSNNSSVVFSFWCVVCRSAKLNFGNSAKAL